MTTTNAASAVSTNTTRSTYTTKRLSWQFAVIPAALVLIYTMLSYISLADQDFFYESMEINVPDNEFLLWSWGGKNTAMLTVLATATITRLRVLLVTALAVLVVGQIGDINAGAQSGTNVFITWIAVTLVAIEAAFLAYDWRTNG